MKDNSDTRINNIKLQRKLLKIRYYVVTIPLFPIIALSFLFSIIFQKWIDWKDDQYQKIEHLRVDLIYIKEHGMTHDEYYADAPVETEDHVTED